MKNRDIEKELNFILSSYGYVNGPVQQRITFYATVESIIEEAVNGKECIAIRCGGVHTSWLIRDFLSAIDVQYLIDRDVSNIYEKINTDNLKLISEYSEEIDLVIISTFEYRKDIIEELKSQNCRNYLDIYEELEKRGFSLEKAYYHYYDEPYKYLIELRNEYHHAESDKPCKLSNLIGGFLDIRDFVTAFEYIDEYIGNKYENSDRMKALKGELELFLQSIQEDCDRRESEDIIWFWQDGLQSFIVDKMSFYQELVHMGMHFENSFTPSPVTRSVYAEILDEINEYDLYDKTEVWPVKHKIIQWLKKKGYECFKVNRLDEKETHLIDYDYHRDGRVIVNNTAATEIYWNALRMLLRDDKKKFLLIHTGVETHLPMTAPNLEEYEKIGLDDYVDRFDDTTRRNYLDRISTTVQYVDKQWEFFYNILSKKCIKIYMSDHGDILSKKSYPFTKDVSQTVLTIVGGKIPTKCYKNLFSIEKFSSLLKYIIEPEAFQEEKIFTPIMRMVGVDGYNRSFIKKMIEIDFLQNTLGFDGYMTLEDRYIVLSTGEEIYHVFPDERTNRINDEKYQERIQWYREKMKREGLRFVDINTNKKFQYSHLIYEALGKPRVF